MASEASRAFWRRRREMFWVFCRSKGKFDDFDAGRDPGYKAPISKALCALQRGCAPALAWDHAVSELCKAGRQGLVKPITWLESLLMDPIKHAHNGCQSQGVDMYSFIHDMNMRLPCGPHHNQTHDQTTTYPKRSYSRGKLCTARRW